MHVINMAAIAVLYYILKLILKHTTLINLNDEWIQDFIEQSVWAALSSSSSRYHNASTI